MKKLIFFVLVITLLTACQKQEIENAITDGLNKNIYGNPYRKCVSIPKIFDVDSLLLEVAQIPRKKELLQEINNPNCGNFGKNSIEPGLAAVLYSYYPNPTSFYNHSLIGDQISIPITQKNCIKDFPKNVIFSTRDVSDRIGIPIHSNTIFYVVSQLNGKESDNSDDKVYNFFNNFGFVNESSFDLILSETERSSLVGYSNFKSLSDVPHVIHYKFIGVYYKDLENDSQMSIDDSQGGSENGEYHLDLCFNKKVLTKVNDYIDNNYDINGNQYSGLKVYFTYKFDYPDWLVNTKLYKSSIGQEINSYDGEANLVKTANGYRDKNQI